MTRRDWYGELDTCEEHPVTMEVERRLVEIEEYRDLGNRIRELEDRLGAAVHGEAAHLWLEVETALNDRRAMAEAEYYNAGVEAGLARGTAEGLLDGPQPPVAATLRALAAVLERLATLVDSAG